MHRQCQRAFDNNASGGPNPSTLDNVNEPDRAAVIRAKLVSGELPRAKPEKVWAGKGTDQPCAGCGGMIASADVEFEVDLPGAPPATLRFHQNCLMIWDQERSPREQAPKKDAPDAGTAA